ncbi:hypothetical protein F5X99DRAFT_394821 [Biscogniauxia marginata]|nr:hypothetical protein F5X99DRAFT_394821 [Biscogniauxia marginata]
MSWRKGTFFSVKTVPTFSTTTINDQENKRWGLRESLGRYGTSVIAGGLIISPVVLGLLAALWGGQGPGNGANASPAWRNIVLKGWVTEAVTLCSLAIQFSASAQSLICTSLTAATLLETTGVPLSQVAEFSTMRGANDGPWSFIWLIWKSSIRRFMGLPPLLMLLLFAGTFATQFTSTILVTDLDVVSILGYANQTALNLSVSDQVEFATPTSSQWHFVPTDYASFGEIWPGMNATPSVDGFSDTGNVKRFLLPMKQDNRTKVHHYRGNAYGLNSRVACAAPVLSGEFQAIDPGSKPVPYLLTMVGNISYEDTFNNAGIPIPPLCADGTCLPANFNCSLLTSGLPGREGINMCLPDVTNVIDTENFTYRSDGRENPITPHSMVFLVSRTNGTFDDWSFIGNVSTIPELSTREDEWAKWELGSGFNFQTSLCFSEYLWEISQTEMSISKDIVEPISKYNLREQQYDVSDIRTLLGVKGDPADTAARSIFSVDAVGNTTLDSKALRHLDASINSYIFGIPDPPASTTINGGGASYGVSSINPEVDYALVFEDTLLETNRPALAIQATFHIMAEALYYALIEYMDTPEPVEITRTVPATIPRRWTGLGIVAGIVCTNLICVLVITTMFLLRTRHSKQGQFWHTISQLVAEQTIDILQASPESRDDHAVARVLAHDPDVMIARCPRTGTVKVLLKSDVESAKER